ncbi:hypothetical protein [Stackebrandtia nassauensis]|uniref:Uncharacterized protein n=1 Tax=Stackebrandtia nassauensis (strain DSM 44728 / CIP 108903 / NRRL B-16338 / NBRC 102104 / LLR-40K-21) TaxID=446470 RepID=D3Q2S5_STANL|nr:hypothetical protein [Stackebrandtia nassauensis]ADD45826.1 hypothetical protein Snas_6203 [Stackebrandtia nassauensis DSM 44728]
MDDRPQPSHGGTVDVENGRSRAGRAERTEIVHQLGLGAGRRSGGGFGVGFAGEFVQLFLRTQERGAVLPEQRVDADAVLWLEFLDDCHCR